MNWLDNILSRWKKPETTPVAAPERLGYRSAQADSTVADALTPKRLVSIIRQANDGDITAQAELFEEMERRDAELLGMIGQRKAGVLACKSEITPGDEDDPRSVKAAEMCEQVMKDLADIEDGDALEDNKFDLLDAIPKGFACLEVMWETSEKQWFPTRLEFRPQRWWTVDQTDRNKLLLRDQADYRGIEVNPLNFIIHRHRAISGTITQSGISLACTRPFVVRNYSLKDWLTMAELFGTPTRIGELPQGASDADVTLMMAALKSLGADAYGCVPFGGKITFADAAGKSASAALYRELMEAMGRWYQIALLGQTLTTGGEGGGSYALGQVHQNVRFDLIDSDARRFDKRWSSLLARISALNFGPEVAPPVYHTIVEEPKDLAGLAAVVQILVNSGVKVPAAWAHETFGIPAPDADEDVLKPAAPLSPFGVANSLSNLSDPTDPSALKKKDGPPQGADAAPPWQQRLARSLGYLK